MIRRKYFLIKSLGIIIITYLLYFFAYCIIARNRLNTIEGKSNFDVTTILNLSKDRITIENEIFNKKEFIEYNCIIDSMYCISIIRVGKITNIELFSSLHFRKQDFPSRDGWFRFDITTPHPMAMIDMVPVNHFPWYNVFLLPLKEIDKINIFVNGKVVDKEYINEILVSYFIEAYSTTFSFNNINKGDLMFSYSAIDNPILVNIFFTVDKKMNLYIGCASTKRGTPKTLKEILDNKDN